MCMNLFLFMSLSLSIVLNVSVLNVARQCFASWIVKLSSLLYTSADITYVTDTKLQFLNNFWT